MPSFGARAVLNRLGDMGGFDGVGLGKVGDGPGKFENSMEGPCRKLEAFDCSCEERRGIGREPLLNEGAYLGGIHFGVHAERDAGLHKALTLTMSGAGNASSHSGREFGPARSDELLVINPRDVDEHVDAVEQRSGDATLVPAYELQRAATLSRRVAEVTAGARVHCRHEHEVGRKRGRKPSPTDGDHTVLQGLAQDFEYLRRELWELIEEEHSTMAECYFAWARDRPATDKTSVGDGVVGRAEGARRDEAGSGGQETGDAVDSGHL